MDSRRDPGTRRGHASPASLAVAVAVGIVGYLAGMATARTTTPSAAPSAAATLVALPTRPSSRATGLASLAPTTQASAPPPWAWRRIEVPLDENLQVESVWGLKDRVLGVASYWGDSWYLPTLTGPAWQLSDAPAAIGRLWGGTVVDDRVWFLAYVTGLRRSEINLRLFGTDGDVDGDSKSLSPSNLDPNAPIRFLGHIDDTWVTAYIGEGGNIEIGAPQHLTWSGDGVHWAPAIVPSLRGVDPFDVAFNSAAASRDFMVVHAIVDRLGAPEDVLLVSDDGVEWRAVAPPEQLDWHADLTCSDRACVLTPYAWEDKALPYPIPIAWVSTDGVTWTPSETTLTGDSSGPGIAYVVATDDGFIGIEGGVSRVAWVSSQDGRTWRRLVVLPEGLKVPIVDLAVGGGYAVALEQGPDVVRQGSWVGSLAAMQIALQ